MLILIASCRSSEPKNNTPSISENISTPTSTSSPIPTPTAIPKTIINVDPIENPKKFIDQIPELEVNCLVKILGDKQNLIHLISSDPGTYQISNDKAKISDECLSYETIERITIGQLDLYSGGLSENSITCIQNVKVGNNSFVYLFAENPPPEIYLITLQTVFCLNQDERKIFENSNLGKLTSSLGGIDKIECFVNEIGPLGLNKLTGSFNSLSNLLSLNKIDEETIEIFLSCGYLDDQLEEIGISSSEVLCILENSNLELIQSIVENNEDLSNENLIPLINILEKCNISIKNTNLKIPPPSKTSDSDSLIKQEKTINDSKKESDTLESQISNVLKESEINCLKQYISEEEIEEILTNLSPTQDLFTAINKCNMNVFEILSRKK